MSIKENLITIRDLSVMYQGQHTQTRAIEHINLEIRRRDFIALLGSSGCGKTTLLNVIAGFVAATDGDISLKGRAITGPGSDRGVIFQETNLYPWLTVAENIAFGLKMANVSEAERKKKTKEYLNIIGMSAYAGHYPFELSGGMQQRVAIARSMIVMPDIILMDEPFGALDTVTRKTMQDFLRSFFASQDITVFLITHDIDEALLLADRVLIMSESPGTIRQEISCDFSRKIREDKNYDCYKDEHYIDCKEQIIDLLLQRQGQEKQN